MKVQYFEGTDTALLEFSNRTPVETREVSENLYVDFDARGNVVGMTLEHVSEQVGFRKLTFQRITGPG